MVDVTQWLTFVVTVSAVVYLPGPGILLTMAYGMEYGFAASLRAAAGCLVANASHWVIVSVGLGTAISRYPQLLMLLRYAGACYLIYLGIMIAWPNRPKARSKLNEKFSVSLNKDMFTRGFIAMFLNPKSFIFFVAILPLFINPVHNSTMQYLILGITFFFLGGSALLSYAFLAVRLKRHLGKLISIKAQKTVSGILLFFAGVYFTLMQVNIQMMGR